MNLIKVKIAFINADGQIAIMDKFPVQFEYNMTNVDIDSILDVFEGENPNSFCEGPKLDCHYSEESDTDVFSENFAEILAIWSQDTNDETWLYNPGMLQK